MAEGVLVIQILGVLFGLFMAYYTFLHYKRKELAIREYIVWVGVWVLFTFFSLFPEFLKPLLKPIGFARVMDFFIVAGFMFLFVSLFYVYLLVRKIQKRIEDIVRKLAMEKK